MKKNKNTIIFILPSLIVIFVLNYLPFFYSLFVSLFSGRGDNLKFSGLKNYNALFQDEVFIKTIINSLTFTAIIVPIIVLFSLYVSYKIFNLKSEKLKNFFTTILYIPCVTSPIAYSLFFKQLSYSNGVISNIMNKLTIFGTDFNMLGSVWSAKIYIAIICIWAWSGFYILFLYTAMKNIDNELYKVAKIDGASNNVIFRKIVLPMIKPVLILMSVLVIIGTFQLHVESSIITKGGPSMGTYTAVNYLYNRAFTYVSQYGYASALGVLVFIVCVLFSIPFIKRMIKNEETI